MPAQPLTEDQLADAGRLKVVFHRWQDARKSARKPWSQDWCSEEMGFGQSALSQYVSGKIPLNPEAAAKFARLTGCEVSEFSPTISKEIALMAGSTKAPLAEVHAASTDAGAAWAHWHSVALAVAQHMGDMPVIPARFMELVDSIIADAIPAPKPEDEISKSVQHYLLQLSLRGMSQHAI